MIAVARDLDHMIDMIYDGLYVDIVFVPDIQEHGKEVDTDHPPRFWPEL